jgi:hypothetical protein
MYFFCDPINHQRALQHWYFKFFWGGGGIHHVGLFSENCFKISLITRNFTYFAPWLRSMGPGLKQALFSLNYVMPRF